MRDYLYFSLSVGLKSLSGHGWHETWREKYGGRNYGVKHWGENYRGRVWFDPYFKEKIKGKKLDEYKKRRNARKLRELEVRDIERLENWRIFGGWFLVFSSRIGGNIF